LHGLRNAACSLSSGNIAIHQSSPRSRRFHCARLRTQLRTTMEAPRAQTTKVAGRVAALMSPHPSAIQMAHCLLLAARHEETNNKRNKKAWT
jgi:hypothetical protein